jgi:hypothetical protein
MRLFSWILQIYGRQLDPVSPSDSVLERMDSPRSTCRWFRAADKGANACERHLYQEAQCRTARRGHTHLEELWNVLERVCRGHAVAVLP